MASLISKAKSKFHEHTDKDATQGQSKVDTGPTQPAQPSNTDAGDSASETTAALDVHNEARTAKGAPPMEWDPSLAQEAEAYAQKLATKNIMEHSDVSGQGENLYMSSGNASFSDAVQNWLDEEKHYSGEKVGEGDFGKWGHFSQCCWSATTNVGMGKATADSGATYVVARYTPPGNMAGQKPF